MHVVKKALGILKVMRLNIKVTDVKVTGHRLVDGLPSKIIKFSICGSQSNVDQLQATASDGTQSCLKVE